MPSIKRSWWVGASLHSLDPPYIFAHACLPGGVFSPLFDRLEERMARDKGESQHRWRTKSEWN